MDKKLNSYNLNDKVQEIGITNIILNYKEEMEICMCDEMEKKLTKSMECIDEYYSIYEKLSHIIINSKKIYSRNEINCLDFWHCEFRNLVYLNYNISEVERGILEFEKLINTIESNKIYSRISTKSIKYQLIFINILLEKCKKTSKDYKELLFDTFNKTDRETCSSFFSTLHKYKNAYL